MIAVTASDIRLNEGYALFSEAGMKSRPVTVVQQTLTHAEIHSIKRIALQPSPFAPAVSRIDAFADLPAGWDSYGARPITREAADISRAILYRLHEAALERGTIALAPYHVAPSPDGGVAIEWRRDGRSIELWITPTGSLTAAIDDPLNGTVEREFHSRDAAVVTIEAVIG
jgi:hypothetical protein